MTQPPLAGLPPETGKQADWLERDKGGGGGRRPGGSIKLRGSEGGGRRKDVASIL